MATWRSEWAALDRGRERAAFYRAWHAAYRAGFPHGKTMRVLGPQPASVQEAVAAIGAGSARGEALTDIVRRAPEAFDAFEAGILEAGEAAGALEGALRLLAEHFTAQDRLMQRVRRQMAYPMSTAVAACVIAPMPLLVFGSPLAYALVAGGAVSVLFLQGGAFVRRVADRFASRPPRPLVRFTRALATALAAGLPLDRAATRRSWPTWRGSGCAGWRPPHSPRRSAGHPASPGTSSRCWRSPRCPGTWMDPSGSWRPCSTTPSPDGVTAHGHAWEQLVSTSKVNRRRAVRRPAPYQRRSRTPTVTSVRYESIG